MKKMSPVREECVDYDKKLTLLLKLLSDSCTLQNRTQELVRGTNSLLYTGHLECLSTNKNAVDIPHIGIIKQDEVEVLEGLRDLATDLRFRVVNIQRIIKILEEGDKDGV